MISKLDDDGNAVPGATLALYEGDTLVERWVSSDQPKAFLGKLAAGGTYRLVEEAAPEGYELAELISFTVAWGTEQTISMVDVRQSIHGPMPGTGQTTLVILLGIGCTIVLAGGFSFIVLRRKCRK